MNNDDIVQSCVFMAYVSLRRVFGNCRRSFHVVAEYYSANSGQFPPLLAITHNTGGKPYKTMLFRQSHKSLSGVTKSPDFALSARNRSFSSFSTSKSTLGVPCILLVYISKILSILAIFCGILIRNWLL